MSAAVTDPADSRLGPLGVLVGTWSGTGHGIYPTIEPFDYLEEITVTDGGVKPFLFYVQRTRAASDGRPLHAEAGYVRWADGRPELVVAQPTGMTEAHHGVVTTDDDGALIVTFDTVALAATGTAKRVDSVTRELRVLGDQLDYELWMAAVGEPHQLHLRATLTRS
ncbi:MAG: FABP family protein [Actinomycetota bacterium]|nr:FABP family protein [Actinomycetota bacterium]